MRLRQLMVIDSIIVTAVDRRAGFSFLGWGIITCLGSPLAVPSWDAPCAILARFPGGSGSVGTRRAPPVVPRELAVHHPVMWSGGSGSKGTCRSPPGDVVGWQWFQGNSPFTTRSGVAVSFPGKRRRSPLGHSATICFRLKPNRVVLLLLPGGGARSVLALVYTLDPLRHCPSGGFRSSQLSTKHSLGLKFFIWGTRRFLQLLELYASVVMELEGPALVHGQILAIIYSVILGNHIS
ncbi:hypothetical protein V8G54_018158 [Vigna mungo]|uniref:Uncharacterized protein n=1 Tax=Vigna mungo TaxID=3915 RepID=A0AAQ3N8B5_VIGMU